MAEANLPAQLLQSLKPRLPEMLATLRRLVSGKFDVANALPLDKVLELSERELERRVIPFLQLVEITK